MPASVASGGALGVASGCEGSDETAEVSGADAGACKARTAPRAGDDDVASAARRSVPHFGPEVDGSAAAAAAAAAAEAAAEAAAAAEVDVLPDEPGVYLLTAFLTFFTVRVRKLSARKDMTLCVSEVVCVGTMVLRRQWHVGVTAEDCLRGCGGGRVCGMEAKVVRDEDGVVGGGMVGKGDGAKPVNGGWREARGLE